MAKMDHPANCRHCGQKHAEWDETMHHLMNMTIQLTTLIEAIHKTCTPEISNIIRDAQVDLVKERYAKPC